MNTPIKIVTGLNDDRTPLLEERTTDKLLEVLCRRANRLVDDRETCERLRPAFREFVYNVIGYFEHTGELDDYTLANIKTALVTADNHGPSNHGVEDYSTFIRRLNPTDPETDRYFVVGREGNISDPGCPMKQLENNNEMLANIPTAQLHMFQAFYYARSQDVTRGAPRIPVEDFEVLVPEEIKSDPVLEEAFLDVVFSDGAWELYQLKLAA
jgi:hypothetical protein